ncbi:MAG: Na+:solute symporter [Saprospiraceae bacterium]|nr:Na+:solute symporter [Saprospiraceae bacterium]
MHLSTLDWSFVAAFFIISLVLGLWASRKAGKNFTEYFLSGRNMPWWLLGISMVATTFSADTPNLVTEFVRTGGVSKNWLWWSFLLTGMLTVFVYAKLWRRSGVLSDLEFYELRYGGKMAAFLRGFRAVYLGVFFNVFIMGTVLLAGTKIGAVLLGLDQNVTLLITCVITVVYTALGGLRGVLLTDFFQFLLAMGGMVAAALVLLNHPDIGGLSNLLTHENVQGKLELLPDFKDTNALLPLLIIPLAVQWWAVWYPGAEPGGGGYVAQRMLAAKDEKNAIGATLLFNVAHYALRPWPWILIALCSLVLFPDIASLEAVYGSTGIDIKDDLAFPAVLQYLPSGLLGIVVASLIAALMSTISTHLNWGSSYIVHDVYQRFYRKEASDSELVMVGRISTIFLVILAAFYALFLQSAGQAFGIILSIGAGTGLIFILRWFWWRINAYSELTAMIVSFLVTLFFEIWFPDAKDHVQLLWVVGVTTLAWVSVTMLTAPESHDILWKFVKLVRPHAMGWKPVLAKAKAAGAVEAEGLSTGNLTLEIAAMFIGCFTVYGVLFGTGYWIYGETSSALMASGVAIIGTWILVRLWTKYRIFS